MGMDILFDLITGGIGGSIIVFLLRNWIAEKMKQSIQYEYSQKLETHKAELNSQIQSIQNKYQIYQLRTSLFFDHQRNAFAQLLSKIADVNRLWFEQSFDEIEEQLIHPVPNNLFEELKELYNNHQLFLDKECLMAMDLILESYSDSKPVYEGNDSPPTPRDIELSYNYTNYLQYLIAGLFRQQIGVSNDLRPIRQIALLGSIKILNQYHFSEIELPVKGKLELKRNDRAADAIMKAEENYKELIGKLIQFEKHLRADGGFFCDAQMKALRFLEILNSIKL
jgi:hypothetical protein